MQKEQKCFEHQFSKNVKTSFWANLGPLMTHKIVHVKRLHVNFSVASDNSLKNYTTTISWKIIEVFAEKHANEKKNISNFYLCDFPARFRYYLNLIANDVIYHNKLTTSNFCTVAGRYMELNNLKTKKNQFINWL